MGKTGRKNKVKGTLRQRKAMKNMVENGGIVSRAMIDAEYSDKTAINPTKLTASRAYQEFFGDLVTDEVLREKHLALLNKKEVRIKNNMTTGEIEVVPTGQLDVPAVKAGLDMAYKVKGSYAPEEHKHKFANVSDEELREELARTITEII